jgi:transcriptional regulator with XRE-family HTH domain
MPETWRDRLQAALDATDLTAAELLRRAKLPATYWHDIMAKGSVPSVERLAKLISVLGYRLDEIYYGDETDPLQLTITGASIEGEMWEELDAERARAVPFRVVYDDFIAITVDTADYEPSFRMGDVLCGRKITGNLDNLIGRDCIIQTKTGERYVKTLQRGQRSGRYTLRSLRRREDILDVKLEWAAPITMIYRD